MGRGPTPELPREHRYSRHRAFWLNLPFALLLVWCLAGGYSYSLLAFLLIILVLDALLFWGVRVKVGEDGITIHNWFRSKTYPWERLKSAKWPNAAGGMGLVWSRRCPPASEQESSTGWRNFLAAKLRQLMDVTLSVSGVEEPEAFALEVARHAVQKSPGAKVDIRGAEAMTGGSYPGGSARWVRWLTRAFVTLGAMVPLLYFGVFFAVETWAPMLAREELELRSQLIHEEQPQSGEDLEKMRLAKKDENSAVVLLAASDLLVGMDSIDWELRRVLYEPDRNLTEGQLAVVRDIVKRNESIVPLLSEAARREQSRYEVDFSAGWDARHLYIGKLHDLADFLIMRDLAELNSEDTSGLDNAVMLFEIAYSLRNQPDSMAMAVRLTFQSRAMLALAQCLASRDLGPEEIELVTALIDRELETMDLRAIIQGERALGLEEIEDFFGGRLLKEGHWLSLCTAPESSARPILPPFIDVIRHWGKIKLLRAYEGVLLKNANSDPGVYSGEIMSGLCPDRKGLGVGNLIWLAGLTRIVHVPQLYHSMRARLLAARIALALYARPNGPPATTEEFREHLGMDVAVDPFGGDPLKYSRTDGGYRVYSVGVDGKDDGGTVTQSDPHQDIVFEVLRMPSGPEKGKPTE